jgi:hypothetical protein
MTVITVYFYSYVIPYIVRIPIPVINDILNLGAGGILITIISISNRVVVAKPTRTSTYADPYPVNIFTLAKTTKAYE